ncbi:hypothetical protein C8T65DRAFT_640920 [Cerioporus squamosus]|nr:hypothetical protein C8T65DRAFT_640920 [Cerioporus squamosus]
MALELPITLNHATISTSLHTLYHALLEAWLLAWPLAFPGGMVLLQYCATQKGLVARVRVFFHRMCEYWRPLGRPVTGLGCNANAGRDGGDGEEGGSGVPLVRYYTPRLLPAYRDEVEEDPEAREFCLTLRAFCKWHRMVFPGPMHPTLKEAREQIKYYSSRDRREMLRICRLVSDDQVFRKRSPWTPRFAKMPDVAVVFE